MWYAEASGAPAAACSMPNVGCAESTAAAYSSAPTCIHALADTPSTSVESMVRYS